MGADAGKAQAHQGPTCANLLERLKASRLFATDTQLDLPSLRELLQRGTPDLSDVEVERLYEAVRKGPDGRVDLHHFVDYVFSEERHILEKPPKRATSLILISDPGQDLDDEMAFVMLRGLVEEGLVDLQGVIATLTPAFERARLARGTLDLLGLHAVPVGIGTDGGDMQGNHTAEAFLRTASTYIPHINSERGMSLEAGRRLLSRLYVAAEPKSLTLVTLASLKDAALFLRDNEALFLAKTYEVVIMGGVQDWEASAPTSARLQPDTAHNNEFDKSASVFFYSRCQDLGVRLVIVSRWAAYAAKMPRATYDELALLGSSIGRRLCNVARGSIEGLWARASAPVGDAARKGLPPRCDCQWFADTFCGGRDISGRGPGSPVWDLVDGFMQYDTLACMAAVPELRVKYFRPASRLVQAQDGALIEHLVIGRTQAEPNIVEPTKQLSDRLFNGFCQGLALNHHFKAQIMLVAQLRGDIMSYRGSLDIKLSCVILRTLSEMEVVDCIGIIVDGEDSTAEEHGRIIQQQLNELGLRSIPVFVAGQGKSAEDHIRFLYEGPLPMGVTLVVVGALSASADFAEHCPELFRDMTARVILTGGAVVRVSSETSTPKPRDEIWLEPNPDAQNNRRDIDNAKKFYNIAQELSVPMVILSSQVAHAMPVPRIVFDVMGTHCGSVGRAVYSGQRTALEQLWQRAIAKDMTERRSLPKRCDAAWFVKSFCSNSAAFDETRVWESVETCHCFSGLSLLASLPAIVDRFLVATEFQARSATHKIVGLSEDVPCVTDVEGFQTLLFQLLLYGARFNISEFDFAGPPPPIPLGTDGSTRMRFDPSEGTLQVIHRVMDAYGSRHGALGADPSEARRKADAALRALRTTTEETRSKFN